MLREVVVFDTEFTAWRGSMERNWRGPGEFKEIVQIGAVLIDPTDFSEIACASVLVRPQRNPLLSNYFENLTRITNEKLGLAGLDLQSALLTFKKFIGERNTFCYGRDDLIIAENCKLLGIGSLCGAQESTNLRLWLSDVGVPLAGVHSGQLATHVGAISGGQVHDALSDSRSLVEAVRYLVARGAPNPFLCT